MLIIDCDVCKINTSSQILTLTFCAWSLFSTCNLFSKAGLHIYARAAARGKRVQVKTSFFSSLIFSCVRKCMHAHVFISGKDFGHEKEGHRSQYEQVKFVDFVGPKSQWP